MTELLSGQIDPPAAANLQALSFFRLVFDDERLVGESVPTMEQAKLLGRWVLSRDVGDPAATHEGMTSRDGRMIASAFINGWTSEEIQGLWGIPPDRARNVIGAVAMHVRSVVDEEQARKVLDTVLSSESLDASHDLFDEPGHQLFWPAHDLSPGADLTEPDSVESRGLNDTLRLQALSEAWTAHRETGSIAQYVKVVDKGTIMHPSFKTENNRLVLNDAELLILNTLLDVDPGSALPIMKLASLAKSGVDISAARIAKAARDLMDEGLIQRHPEDPNGVFINQDIIFMEERPDYASRVEYETEFDRIIGQIHDDLRYAGWAYVEDDAVLGLGDAFTAVLEKIFSDPDIVRQHEHDHPPTRKRADGAIHAHKVNPDEQFVGQDSTMPHWSIILPSGETLKLVESRSNTLDTTETIEERPPELSRLWVHSQQLLRRFVEVAYLATPPECLKGGNAKIRPHAFRTDGAVVETDHQDKVGLAIIRCAAKKGMGASTYLRRRRHELLPDTEYETRPCVSIEIPPNGMLLFMDRRFLHGVTYLYPAPADNNA